MLYSPEYKSSPRGKSIHEITNVMFKVQYPVSEPIVTSDPKRNLVLRDYFAKEKELYDSMTNRAEDFAAASKFWAKIANPDGTINSAYGHLIWQVPLLGDPEYEKAVGNSGDMRTPWEWALHSLKSDRDTRQAVVPFAAPHHYWHGNKDQVCTLHGIFQIRDNALHLTVVMRSNDLVKGLAYDMPWFVLLMDRMLVELKDIYPGLTKGSYTHMTHSAHIYLEDAEKVRLMLGTHTQGSLPGDL